MTRVFLGLGRRLLALQGRDEALCKQAFEDAEQTLAGEHLGECRVIALAVDHDQHLHIAVFHHVRKHLVLGLINFSAGQHFLRLTLQGFADAVLVGEPSALLSTSWTGFSTKK